MKRDFCISIIPAEPDAINPAYALTDDMGRYADPRTAKRRVVNVFPERAALPSACFGINCHRHRLCDKYHSMDGSSPDAPRMATCFDGHGYHGFTPVRDVHHA